MSLTVSDPLQLVDQRRLLPLREVYLGPVESSDLAALFTASKLPGPLQNTARSVPSGPVAGASTNTLSERNMGPSSFSTALPHTILKSVRGCSGSYL